MSRFVKDVPSTLTDMADGAADAVGATATGTNADGSYTNAGEAVEVRALTGCISWGYLHAYLLCILVKDLWCCMRLVFCPVMRWR